ncbi:Hypothetical protein FKW44_005297, partial [Caligus rogercresseyi]
MIICAEFKDCDIIVAKPTDTLIVGQTKFLVANIGMPPHLLKKRFKFHSEEYMKLMMNVVTPWITKITVGRP